MRRVNSWVLLLLAAAGAAAIYGVLVFKRWGGDPSVAELVHRLPASKALTLHVDLAAIRSAGLAELLEGSAVAEEPDYRRFVTESGFDWKRDLEAVTATHWGNDWYFFVKGSFDMEKIRNFALSRNGTCKNGVCDVAGATPGRRVSFYPITPRVLAIATSNATHAVYNISDKKSPDWQGGIPPGPVWVSFNGSVLAGDPTLPSGGRLFGKVLSETQRTSFSIVPSATGLELKMRAFNSDVPTATNVKSQLEGVTREFKAYFERVGQATTPGDLSGLLLAGEFALNGTEVTGRWPIHPELLKKLAGGTL